MNKLLPTATAGSLPKPSWLAEPEKTLVALETGRGNTC